MADGSAAEVAYQAALREIERVKAEGGKELVLSGEAFANLDRIPPKVTEIAGLVSLNLNGTKISDLSPLRDMTALHILWLNKTAVSDLSPLGSITELHLLSLEQTPVGDLSALRKMTRLQSLWLNQTAVTDLRPIAELPFPSYNNAFLGLRFKSTTATERDPELQRLSAIKGNKRRTRETLAYLKTLPPWPEPLPWLEAAARPGLPAVTTETRPILVAEAQIASLLRNALVTRITAGQLAGQIEAALVGVPATMGNRLPDVLQSMADVAEVLRALVPEAGPMMGALDEAHLRLRIAQLEAIVERLTSDLADERKRREAADALAAKDGFLHSYRKSAGTAAGVATVGLVTVGVPAAAVYFLGTEHPLVQAVLTVLGRLPKT